ncbi:MAG TPA: FAD-binding oxidoreductase [Chitinophagaceae bacterium]|nr:FAD-binding oxidoreductase [Chitinophagaceae bacterium]
MQASVWEQDSYYSHRHIIIVGAGLAGLWSAIELKRHDKTLKILLLEKGAIPSGASTRNAGFACFGSPTELLHDAATLGEDNMWTIAEMRYQGLCKIRRFLGDGTIDFDPCGGYELLDERYNGDDALEEKLVWLNEGLAKITGEDKTFSFADEKLKPFKFNSFKHIIENKFEGGLHSGKLVGQLTQKVLALGVEIINGVAVTGWEKQQGYVEVNTAGGKIFSCDKLLICNNGYASDLIKNIKTTPARGQVLVTSPLQALPFKGTFHVEEGFYYFRNLGNRVLLGGARNKAFEEEKTTEMEVTDVIQSELERFLKEKILPGQTYTIENRWSGIMGFTETKLPIADEVAPGVYVLITCNGMGVALSPIMAEKAAALICGQ